jgi:hypothetical protein
LEIAVLTAVLGLICAILVERYRRRGVFGELFGNRVKQRINLYNILLEYGDKTDTQLKNIQTKRFSSRKIDRTNQPDCKTGTIEELNYKYKRQKEFVEELVRVYGLVNVNDALARMRRNFAGHDLKNKDNPEETPVIPAIDELQPRAEKIRELLSENRVLIGPEFYELCKKFYELKMTELLEVVTFQGIGAKQILEYAEAERKILLELGKHIPKAYRNKSSS